MYAAFLRRLVAAFSFLPLFLPAPAAHAEPTWTEVRSPHFRVLTDGSGRDARLVAHEFEQMRYVFVLRFGNSKVESGAPLTIVAARDGNTLRELEPGLWKAEGDKIAGEFHRGWEKQFALVRLDEWSTGAREVVYHEYTHSILHANAHWLPTWLDEGMAEFYAYTRFQGDRIYIGAPTERYAVLNSEVLIPATEMLGVDQRSPYYHDDRKMQLFYAESWALVHFMTFGPGMDAGAKLEAFYKDIQDHPDQQAAFRAHFGDPRAFDNAFAQYVRRFTFTAGVLPPGPIENQKTYAERKLSPPETAYELGCFHIGAHDRKIGRALLEKALALDPKLAAAHEELGFLDFAAGNDKEATLQWEQALALDPSLPRTRFALAMSGTPLSRQTEAQLRETETAMQRVLASAPGYAPAYVELALVEWRLRHLQEAYNDVHKAEALEPWRAGYHILAGRILLAGNQPAIAANYSRYVALHWFGPDHNEAVDLWDALPSNARGSDAQLTPDFPSGVKTARGTLTALSCQDIPGGGRSVTATLQPEGNAKPLTLVGGRQLRIGFSDTLWWGEDHFSPCYHLADHPAVVAYKAGSNELLDLEVRDDLPGTGAPPKPATETATAQP